MQDGRKSQYVKDSEHFNTTPLLSTDVSESQNSHEA